MNNLSFVTANFVARELDYNITEGWHQGNNATNDYFRPIDTFPKRFDAMLREIKQLGFQSIDLWVAHFHWAWASKDHIKIANSLLTKHRIKPASMVGSFGETPLEFEAACKLANALGIKLLTGHTKLLDTHRDKTVELLRKYRLRHGIINHSEKNAEELLKRIGNDNRELLGTVVDTGWFASQGADLLQTFEDLAPTLMLVQLKNIESQTNTSTTRFDKGYLSIQDCVSKLKELKFNGTLSIEHTPFNKDPTKDCKANLSLLQTWLKN